MPPSILGRKIQYSGKTISSFAYPLSIPLLLAHPPPDLLADWSSELCPFRILGESSLQTPLSQLRCQRTGYKKLLSPTPGGKACLQKASTGARLWLRHQDKVLTPAALDHAPSTAHAMAPGLLLAALDAGATGALGLHGERACISQGQRGCVASSPQSLGCLLAAAGRGEGQGGCSAGCCGAVCCGTLQAELCLTLSFPPASFSHLPPL